MSECAIILLNMNTLNDEIKPINGNMRTFLLMRIAGLNTDLSMKLVGVTRGTYNSWFKNGEFQAVYKKLSNLIQDHRQEAVLMLRRDNQLEAVLLEGKILAKMKEEIKTGELSICKTNLGREVYSKLISDLDVAPANIKSLTWEQRVFQLNSLAPQMIPKETTIDGEFEEVSEQSSEHPKSLIASKGEQRSDEAPKDSQS